MQVWVFGLLAGVANAFGNDQPNDDAPADYEGHEKKDQAEASMSFIHGFF